MDHQSPLLAATRIAGLYVLVSLGWILGSDSLVSLLFTAPAGLHWAQTLKGSFFVAASGLFLGVLIHRELLQRRRTNRKLRGTLALLDAGERLAGLAVWMLDAETRQGTWITPGTALFRPTLPQPPDSLDTLTAMMPREDRSATLRAFEDVARTPARDRVLDVTITPASSRPPRRLRLRFSSDTPEDGAAATAGVICALVDVTEERRREDDLRRILDEATRANAELARFSHATAHDLKEPARAIAGFAKLLGRRLDGRLDAEEQEMFQFLEKAAARTHALVSDTLTFARLDTVTERFAPVDLTLVLDKTLATLHEGLEEAGATLAYPDRLPIVRGEEGLLAAVFHHLISNAIKYRAPGRPLSISLTCRQENGQAILTLTDNGVGIPADQREKVFEAFHRLHADAEIPGSGLGLASCRRILHWHGGTIHLEDSEGGVGTRVRFALPLSQI